MNDLYMPESLLILAEIKVKRIHFVGQSNLVQNILAEGETILPSNLIDMTLWLWQEVESGVRTGSGVKKVKPGRGIHPLRKHVQFHLLDTGDCGYTGRLAGVNVC